MVSQIYLTIYFAFAQINLGRMYEKERVSDSTNQKENEIQSFFWFFKSC